MINLGEPNPLVFCHVHDACLQLDWFICQYKCKCILNNSEQD